MAIFKCNSCGHIQEAPKEFIGKRAKCPICKESSLVSDTITYIKYIERLNNE